EGIGGAAGGAEAENNRASFWVRGWPGVGEPSSKVRVENPNSALYQGAGAPSRETRVSMRAKSGSPAAVARYLADFLNRVAREVPPHFTHTTNEAPRVPHDPKMKVVFVKNDIHAWVKMPVEYDPRRVRMVDAQHDNMI